jgi:uncharacterized SAM-dependent methyltransferase
MSYFNKEREECIELLLNLGAEDLTHVRHPNKQGKKYLKLRIKNLNSYITFNFDYSEYREASVWATRRSKPRAYMKFKDIKPMLIDMGFEIVKKQETLEEAAENRYVQGVYVINGIDICEASRECFIEGAKWAQERMYSELEVKYIVSEALQSQLVGYDYLEQWFTQFKKK